MPTHSMVHPDKVRLQHMLDASKEATSFIKGKSRKDLDDNRILALALVQSLGIIGEAATKISKETREEYPDIPWADIAGMRNRLTHEYFNINYDIVWKTVTEDLPLLITALERKTTTI